MYAIVTGFFDINRQNWDNVFRRDMKDYLENAKSLFKTPEDMIVFVEPKLVDFVKENRNKDYTTHIISMEYNDLFYASKEEEIKKIMISPKYTKNLEKGYRPECCMPKYNVVIWSKLDLLKKASLLYPQYSHFAWVDFGIHKFILKKPEKRIYPKGIISDRIKLHCINKPNISSEFDKEKFLKSIETVFTSGSITGNKENLSLFRYLFDEEVKNLLDEKLVSSEQTIFTFIYRKYPWLFELSYGNWNEIFTNYYEIRENKNYVLEKFGPSVFNFKNKKIVLVLPAGVINVGNEFIGMGLVNLISSLFPEGNIFRFEAERLHDVFLKEEIEFVNSCDVLIYAGGSIIGDFCYKNFLKGIKNITIPKILIGAGFSHYNKNNSEICTKFLNIFDWIYTRDDVTYNFMKNIRYSNVFSGLDMAFFSNESINIPPNTFKYTINNVEVNSSLPLEKDFTYKLENKYKSSNHVWCGKHPYLSHGYWETLFSLYANASYVETSRVHTLLVCILNGVECVYKNPDHRLPDRHSLFCKIGLDLTIRTNIYKNEFIKRIKKEKEIFRNNIGKFITKLIHKF